MMTLLLAALAQAGPGDDAQLAELERIRAQVGNEVHLAAFDLLDELVYGWITAPPFAEPTPVVLAGVTVPVGTGSGLQALVENHVSGLLIKNPTSNVKLAHCPSCTAVVVQSGPGNTIVSRGIDNPTALAELGGTGQHALFLDLEAEGPFLVLRARITRLSPELPIVWSHTISTSTGTPALLRQSDHLKSAAEAHEEYVDALRDRGPIAVPFRIGIRSYAQPDEQTTTTNGQTGVTGIAPPPFLWAQTGVELSATRAQAWTGSVVVGFSYIPQAYQGIMAQGRVNRLVTGRARSHTRPDLYAFVGAGVFTLWGPGTATFRDRVINGDEQVLLQTDPTAFRTTFGALQMGLDLRVGYRMGVSAFLENIPTLGDSANLGDHVRIAGIGFQSLGTEVTFWF